MRTVKRSRSLQLEPLEPRQLLSYFAPFLNGSPSVVVNGSLILNGGTLTHNTWPGFASGTNGAGAGYLQMTGGVINGSNAVNPIQIGAFQGTAGILHGLAVLSGGNIIENGSSGGSGSAVSDVTNGVANFIGTNATASGVGFLNLLGGEVNTKVAWGTSGNITNFNGGTLQALNSTASGANGTLIPGSGNGSVYIWGGGAIIDTNGTPSTIVPSSGAAGILNLSGGVLQFSGAQGTTPATIGNISANGNVTSIPITNPGAGYTSAPTVVVEGSWNVNGSQILRSSSGGGAYTMTTLGNGSLALTGTAGVSNFSFGAGAHLDLRNNALIVEATTANKAALLAAIAGDTTSNSTTSSPGASNPAYGIEVIDNGALGATNFGGLALDPNSIIVTQALLADANLDGVVNPSDLLMWANNFNKVNQSSVATGDNFPQLPPQISSPAPSPAPASTPGPVLLSTGNNSWAWFEPPPASLFLPPSSAKSAALVPHAGK